MDPDPDSARDKSPAQPPRLARDGDVVAPVRNVYLVWDGGDEIHIPPPMLPSECLGSHILYGNAPNIPPFLKGRMAGTTAERLCELAGRICYDSLNAEKSRDSDGYHAHIREVGHLSTIEHFPFTVSVPWVHEYIPSCLLNRPGLWTTKCLTRLRLTANLRTAAEWFKDAERDGPVDGSMVRIGACLQFRAYELAPRIVNLSEDWAPPQSNLARIEDPIIQAPVVAPMDDHEKWISLYIRCSRGCSHELVRHGDFTAISQRSTRYCDESESPWIEHPLIAHFRRENITNQAAGCAFAIDSAEYKGKNAYTRLVSSLQEWLISRGIDKLSARKQARGAARGYLGNALETELIFSASVSQWLWMLKLRCSDAADAEIRAIFVEALHELQKSRYASSFTHLVLRPSRDGIGMTLDDGVP